MDRLLELADHFNIKMIEDACHAFRANYKVRNFWPTWPRKKTTLIDLMMRNDYKIKGSGFEFNNMRIIL